MRGRVGADPATALREHLIDTAERLLTERPISAVTTRDLARAGGLSEGVLYNYFADKHDLLVTALVRRYGRLTARFDTGLPTPGTGTVEENLVAYLRAALDLVAETLPVVAGLVNEPALLHRFMHAIHTEPFGPHRFRQPIADYLAGERRLGRLGDVDVDAATTLLLGPALMLGFAGLMTGRSRADLAADLPGLVATLVRGLLPAATDRV